MSNNVFNVQDVVNHLFDDEIEDPSPTQSPRGIKKGPIVSKPTPVIRLPSSVLTSSSLGLTIHHATPITFVQHTSEKLAAKYKSIDVPTPPAPPKSATGTIPLPNHGDDKTTNPKKRKSSVDEDFVPEDEPEPKRAKLEITPAAPAHTRLTRHSRHAQTNALRYVELATSSDDDHLLVATFHLTSIQPFKPNWSAIFGRRLKYFTGFESHETDKHKYTFALSKQGLKHFKNSRKAVLSEMGALIYF